MTSAETWNNPRSSKQDVIGEAFRQDDADSDPSVVINDLFPYLSNQSRLDFIMTGEPHYCYAIAQLGNLSADVCAALSEMADEAGVIRLAENHAAPIPTFSLIRLLFRRWRRAPNSTSPCGKHWQQAGLNWHSPDAGTPPRPTISSAARRMFSLRLRPQPCHIIAITC